MFRLTALLLILLTVFSPAAAGYPLPDDLQPITPDNAAQLAELVYMGGALPGGLAWSPHSTLLAAGTTSGVELYSLDNLASPLLEIPAGPDVAFSENGDTLISDNQLWDLDTGESLRVVETPVASRIVSPGGRFEVTTETGANGIVVLLRDTATDENATLDTSIPAGFSGVVFSPDEQYIALRFVPSDYDYSPATVQLWDIQNAALVAALPQSFEFFDTVTFHAGGALLVVATYTDAPYGGPFDEVVIYDGRTGERIGPSEYGYIPVVFSPDGQLMAFLTGSGLAIWSNTPLGVLDKDLSFHGEGTTKPVFSPDSRTLAVSENGGRVTLLEVSTVALPVEPLLVFQAEGEVSDLAFSPDGTVLAGGEEYGQVHLWDIQTGEELASFDVAEFITRMQFTPDGTSLLTEQFGGNLLFWDVASGEQRASVPRRSPLSADWSHVAYWDGGIVIVVDTATGAQTELNVIEDYWGTNAAFNAVLGWAVFVGDEVRGYDLETGEQVFSLPIADRPPQVFFNEIGTRMVTKLDPVIWGRGNPMVMTIYDTSNMLNPIAVIEIPDGSGDFLFSPDGRLLASSEQVYGECQCGREELWEVESGTMQAEWNLNDYGENDHAFSPDGQFLATGAYDSLITLWDVNATIEQPSLDDDGRRVEGVAQVSLLGPDFSDLEQLTVSSNGGWLAAQIASRDFKVADIEYTDVYVWPLADALHTGGTVEEGYVLLENAQSPLFTLTGEMLLTKDAEGEMVHLWDSRTGAELAFMAGDGLAAFSPDGSLLVTHSMDGLSIWDVAVLAAGNTEALAVLPEENVSQLVFNPDGSLLFARNGSGVSIYGDAV